MQMKTERGRKWAKEKRLYSYGETGGGYWSGRTKQGERGEEKGKLRKEQLMLRVI